MGMEGAGGRRALGFLVLRSLWKLWLRAGGSGRRVCPCGPPSAQLHRPGPHVGCSLGGAESPVWAAGCGDPPEVSSLPPSLEGEPGVTHFYLQPSQSQRSSSGSGTLHGLAAQDGHDETGDPLSVPMLSLVWPVPCQALKAKVNKMTHLGPWRGPAHRRRDGQILALAAVA